MENAADALKIAGAVAVYGLVIASPVYKVPTENDKDLTNFELVSVE